MKLRGLSPTIALYVLLLGLLCLLPATQATAVDCTNIQKSDSVMDILAACERKGKLSGPNEVNLALGTLDQAQLDALLKMKDGLNVGIHLRESAVGRIKSGVRDILLEDMCSIWISDNLKLEKIDFNSLNSLKSTTSGPYMQISNNPKLTSIDIPAGTISVPIVVKNNGRLDQAGVDTLKGASFTPDDLDVADPGVCEFHDLKDAAFLDGCHTNKGTDTIKLLPGANQSATWDDVKLHIEGCLEAKITELTTLDFLKDAPGGCPDPVITGNKELCSFGPLTTVDTLTNCDAKCFKWTELSGKTCAVGETDMMIDFNGDASLTRAHIERLVEVHGALSISNFPDDRLTINLQKMTIPAGASQMGLTIKGDKLNKLEFTHPIVFNPTPAAGVVLLTVETNSWTYNEQEIQKIIADSGIQREQMLFNGQVPIFTTTSAPTTAPPPPPPGGPGPAPSPAGGPSGSGGPAGAATASPRGLHEEALKSELAEDLPQYRNLDPDGHRIWNVVNVCAKYRVLVSLPSQFIFVTSELNAEVKRRTSLQCYC